MLIRAIFAKTSEDDLSRHIERMHRSVFILIVDTADQRTIYSFGRMCDNEEQFFRPRQSPLTLQNEMYP